MQFCLLILSIEHDATGFLSSLMGPDCECHGYNIRIVGHSLGGSISSLLGIRSYGRFPNLHVYSFGPLPCVDSIVADSCSDFVTRCHYALQKVLEAPTSTISTRFICFGVDMNHLILIHGFMLSSVVKLLHPWHILQVCSSPLTIIL
ncbi:hypothetical protein MKW98_011948 [Papaver atlanticum]|uniref:Fungal lipase-type domain-containing protein n=1 Tax=Papaver atlanticum TaxID=357466 RepID=A0AAD4T5K0_9MAGN|nr:hypothetical protein MKW98_011948 [Papaver atlanticum]